MNEFTTAILEDLRRFSPELLDPGTQRSAWIAAGRRGIGALSDELERAATLGRLVPALASELATDDGDEAAPWRPTRVPVRAVPSHSPWHWERSGSRWLPNTWLTPEIVSRSDRASARWIEHLIGVLDARLETRRARVAKHLEDAGTHAPTSVWARQELEAQKRLLERIGEARGELARARFVNAQAAGGRVTPSAAAPAPYPRTPPWIALRRLAEGILDERRALQAGLAGLLAGHVEVADEPYLYQRWVGVKVLDALAEHGWQAQGDVVGALYLGGVVRLASSDIEIALHVEPRLSESSDHPSGCYCSRGREVTPDFLLVTPGPSGREVHVLDASKSTDRDVLRGKYRYLELIAQVKPRRIAGVWTRHPPRRAWAAAPLDRGVCDIDRPDGSCGIVPMNPTGYRSSALSAWISDIDLEARTWARAAPSPVQVRR